MKLNSVGTGLAFRVKYLVFQKKQLYREVVTWHSIEPWQRPWLQRIRESMLWWEDHGLCEQEIPDFTASLPHPSLCWRSLLA